MFRMMGKQYNSTIKNVLNLAIVMNIVIFPPLKCILVKIFSILLYETLVSSRITKLGIWSRLFTCPFILLLDLTCYY